jgi:hypothetical protein
MRRRRCDSRSKLEVSDAEFSASCENLDAKEISSETEER